MFVYMKLEPCLTLFCKFHLKKICLMSLLQVIRVYILIHYKFCKILQNSFKYFNTHFILFDKLLLSDSKIHQYRPTINAYFRWPWHQ